MSTPSAFVIELPQGSLAIHDLSIGSPSAAAPVVLAVHGITANGLSWRRVADEIGHRHGPGAVRFLAPDLRGRGDSRSAPGPYGLAAHVDDLISIATAFGSAPVLVGHSMGAFIAALAAARHPERFPAAVLVDGGLAFPVPPDLDAAREHGVRAELLWAERGLLDEPQGLYDETRLAALHVPAGVRTTKVDANHCDVILGARGVAAVADAIDRQLVGEFGGRVPGVGTD